jgi:FtsP/CotA-like multicopper oxidase with cupredoxin domain
MDGAAQTSPDDSYAQHMHHEHHGMRMDMDGMVMNENVDQLPRDCAKISGEQNITVRAGKKYAQQLNGIMFTYDQREWNVEPCARVTVTLINEDDVRHQWMLHGLPRYLYPEGMFHLEVNGQAQKTGTFIVPSAKKTYLVHCDIAQHTEKGMKAQLKVGGGSGNLSSIPGITGPRQADRYLEQWNLWGLTIMGVAGVVSATLIWRSVGRVQ